MKARIIAAAVMDHNECVFTGSYHGDAIDNARLNEATPIPNYTDESWDVPFKLGFMDEDGEFLTREQAYWRGIELNQLVERAHYKPNDPDGCIHTCEFKIDSPY